jgi:hypothetical protein
MQGGRQVSVFSIHNCHENGEFAHEKSKTYEQLAIFMPRGAPGGT